MLSSFLFSGVEEHEGQDADIINRLVLSEDDSVAMFSDPESDWMDSSNSSIPSQAGVSDLRPESDQLSEKQNKLPTMSTTCLVTN